MSLSVVKHAGKAMLIVAGVAYGFRRGFASRPQPSPGGLDEIAARLDRLEETLARPNPLIPARPGNVSHEELAEAIDRAAERILTEVDRRFEVQTLSIGSLRALIDQTDQLLEKVLSHLEDAGSQDLEQDEEPVLTSNSR